MQNRKDSKLYRQAYFKALLDMYNLIAREQGTFKFHRIDNSEHVLKMINFCIENIEDMMLYGDKIEFYCEILNKTKGKKREANFLKPDSEEVKKFNQFRKQELARPYSYLSVLRKKRTLEAQHLSHWFEYFYEEYKDKPLEPKAKEFFDKICEKNDFGV